MDHEQEKNNDQELASEAITEPATSALSSPPPRQYSVRHERRRRQKTNKNKPKPNSPLAAITNTPVTEVKLSSENLPTTPLPASRESTFEKAHEASRPLRGEAHVASKDLKTLQGAGGAIQIVQRHYARATRMFDLYCEGISLNKIAECFNVSRDETVALINNFYAYKMRHDPTLRKHCKDQIRAGMQMLAENSLRVALSEGKDSIAAARIFMEASEKIMEWYYPRPVNRENEPAGETHHQTNVFNMMNAEPYEMMRDIKNRLNARTVNAPATVPIETNT